MKHNKTKINQALEFIKNNKLVKAGEFEDAGFPREYLKRLLKQQKIIKVTHGLYKISNLLDSEYSSLAQAAKKYPNSVVCLLSALNYYQLTSEFPFQVWLAFKRNSWIPKVTDLPIRITRFSNKSFSSGIVIQEIDGIVVRIYSPAKTVADCFKFRYKIGLDVGISALTECIRQRKATIDQIWHYSEICRVSNVIRPYLEGLVGAG